MVDEIQVSPSVFKRLASGEKTFYRYSSEDYPQRGDQFKFIEIDSKPINPVDPKSVKGPTGQELICHVTYAEESIFCFKIFAIVDEKFEGNEKNEPNKTNRSSKKTK